MTGCNPKIRFREFTDDWERRSLSDFTYFAGKRNKKNLPLRPYAITNDKGFVPQDEAHNEFGYMKNVDRTAYNIVPPNSFAYNPARINVGSIGYYAGPKDVIVSSLYEVFRADSSVYDRFLWYWLNTDEFPRWIKRLQEGSVRLYFYYDKLCECEMLVPTIAEQRKIADFLDSLHSAICAYQDELSALYKIKTGFINDIFSKKIRFKDTNGNDFPEWEHVELNTIGKFCRGGSLGKDDITEFGTKCILYGQLYTTYREIIDNVDTYCEEKRNLVYAKENDLLFPLSTTVDNLSLISPSAVCVDDIAIGGDIAIFRPERDSAIFLSYQINNYLKTEFARYAQGSTIVHISPISIGQRKVWLPSLPEQLKISNFLSIFDKRIAMKEKEIELLKVLEKGFLQKMFINN